MSNLEPTICQMVSQCSAVPAEEIKLEHNLFKDLGMDSVSAMELIGLMDEELDLEIQFEESAEIQTVQEIVDLARKHLDRAA